MREMRTRKFSNRKFLITALPELISDKFDENLKGKERGREKKGTNLLSNRYLRRKRRVEEKKKDKEVLQNSPLSRARARSFLSYTFILLQFIS